MEVDWLVFTSCCFHSCCLSGSYLVLCSASEDRTVDWSRRCPAWCLSATQSTTPTLCLMKCLSQCHIKWSLCAETNRSAYSPPPPAVALHSTTLFTCRVPHLRPRYCVPVRSLWRRGHDGLWFLGFLASLSLILPIPFSWNWALTRSSLQSCWTIMAPSLDPCSGWMVKITAISEKKSYALIQIFHLFFTENTSFNNNTEKNYRFNNKVDQIYSIVAVSHMWAHTKKNYSECVFFYFYFLGHRSLQSRPGCPAV